MRYKYEAQSHAQFGDGYYQLIATLALLGYEEDKDYVSLRIFNKGNVRLRVMRSRPLDTPAPFDINILAWYEEQKTPDSFTFATAEEAIAKLLELD